MSRNEVEQNGNRNSAAGVRALTAQLSVGTMVAKFATRASMALDRPVCHVLVCEDIGFFSVGREKAGWQYGAWTRTGMEQKK
jgi:hypothetical protein